MTKREFDLRKQKLEDRNTEIKQLQALQTIKNRYRKKRKLSTSKIILVVVFVICIQILVFSEYAMLRFGDLSAMYALIGVPATIVPTVIAYFSKSKAENSANGITYEMAMLDRMEGTPPQAETETVG